jgi:hypothetical protein
MTTIRLKGPGLNDYFAEKLVDEYGPEGARERCSGPALAAVERVIEFRTLTKGNGDTDKGEGA